MKAIVLTYDKYQVFTEHMIDAYQKVWPDNPFTFRLPFQLLGEYYRNKYQDKVELIKSESDIVSTMNTLLNGLDENEWIYWCMDDRYPIFIDTKAVNQIYQWVKTIQDTSISAILFLNSRKGQKPQNLHYFNKKLVDTTTNKYRQRKNYTMIWMHQFMRVKVMRHLFSHFPTNLKSAKEMDYIMFKLQLPQDHKLYVLNKNLGIFGESTSRGKLTKNCYSSLKKGNYNIPDNFEVGDKHIVIGEPTSLLDDAYFWIKTIIKIMFGKS